MSGKNLFLYFLFILLVYFKISFSVYYDQKLVFGKDMMSKI